MISFSDLLTAETPPQVLRDLFNRMQGVGQVQQKGRGALPPLGTGDVQPSGPPSVAFQCVVRISNTGTNGDGIATFDFSTDGGLTFPGGQSNIPIPASGIYLIPNTNVTLTFVPGQFNTSTSFLKGEAYSFEATVPSLPVTDWNTFASLLSLAEAEAISLSDLENFIADAGMAATPLTAQGAWADMQGENWFNEQRAQGVTAQILVELSCSAAAGPYPLTPGEVTVSQIATGLVYQNVSDVNGNTNFSIPSGGSILAIFQAVQVGAAYNAPTHYPPSSAAVIQLNTSLVGVTVDNPPVPGADIVISHGGTGTGTLALAGTPTGVVSVIAKIQSTGSVGTATFSYSLDGGNTFIGPFPTSGGFTVVGVVGTFAGASGTAFVQGDTFNFSTSSVVQTGVDLEATPVYMLRCINKWGSLAPSAQGPGAQYAFWAKKASTEVASCYTQAANGGVLNVTVSSLSSGAVSSAALAAIQNFIQPRSFASISVRTAVDQDIPLVATVYVSRSQLANAKAYVAQFMEELQGVLGVGAVGNKGQVNFLGNIGNSPLAVLDSAPGVQQIEGYTMGGGTADIAMVAPNFPIFVLTGLTYIPV